MHPETCSEKVNLFELLKTLHIVIVLAHSYSLFLELLFNICKFPLLNPCTGKLNNIDTGNLLLFAYVCVFPGEGGVNV